MIYPTKQSDRTEREILTLEFFVEESFESDFALLLVDKVKNQEGDRLGDDFGGEF